MPADSPTRIAVLDGVRGYASLWVMLGHFSTRTGLWIPFLKSPGIAVDLFMLVSGFLMTQHFFARETREPWGSPRTWLLFYMRRLFRIAPLYYLLLVPSFLAYNALNDAQQRSLKTLLNIDYHPSAAADIGNILTHVAFVFGLFPTYSSALAIPDWSLGLEMQFYAIFPFLALLARRLNVFRFGLLLLPAWWLSLALRDATRHHGLFFDVVSMPSFLPLKLGLFVIGILLAWAWTEERGKLTARAGQLLFLAVVFAATARNRTAPGTSEAIILATTIGLALVLFRVEPLSNRHVMRALEGSQLFLDNRLARFLADVSYGVYLMHLLVMIPVLTALCNYRWFVYQRSISRFVILTAIAGPLTYGLAWILFRWVESPCIGLGRKLTNRLSSVSRIPAPDGVRVASV